jgi:hypothetical protein
LESMVMAGFSIAAVVGFKSSAWIVVAGSVIRRPWTLLDTAGSLRRSTSTNRCGGSAYLVGN